MAVKIQPNQIQNLQQMEVVVAGPEDANRLVVINGQFDVFLSASGTGAGFATTKEIFTALIGPTFTRKQFVKANATASLAKTQIVTSANVPPAANWNILNVDADWDDESGQVELSIEAQVGAGSAQLRADILGFLFQVTILAAVPAD